MACCTNPVPTSGPRRLLVRRHRARWQEFQDYGTLLLIGAFNDRTGSMAVFSTREAAEEFAGKDPFVLNEVVSSWRVHEWNEAIGG